MESLSIAVMGGEAGELREEQLRKMNPEATHKRAAAATASSPLLSLDVNGCFIRVVRVALRVAFIDV